MNIHRLFKPARGESISEDVARQVEAAILGGKIMPGERLPSERDLQMMFETGRGAIREALRALKQKGLIEIKKGVKGGAYIKEVEVATASESMALLLKQRMVPVKNLIEFRESIDHTITTLATTRGKAAEKKALQSLTQKLHQAACGGKRPNLAQIADIDRRLNLLLAKMTRNPVFEWAMRTIQISFGSYDAVLYEDPYYREKTTLNWINTAREIASGEPLRALSFIGYHYVLLQRCIKEKGINSVSQGVPGNGEPH